MEITTKSSPRSPRNEYLPCLGREGHVPGCRLRVPPAGAPASLGHDRCGVGGARSGGAGGDGRVAPRPGRSSDEPPAAGGGGRDPLPGPLRGGVAGAAPADFPPWQAVYAFFERWAARGLPQAVVDRLRGQLRVGAGRAELPTAAVIDSQSVSSALSNTSSHHSRWLPRGAQVRDAGRADLRARSSRCYGSSRGTCSICRFGRRLCWSSMYVDRSQAMIRKCACHR